MDGTTLVRGLAAALAIAPLLVGTGASASGARRA